MNIENSKSLKHYNTFGIDVIAKRFIEIRNEDTLQELSDNGEFQTNSFLFLGGGSNLLFIDDVEQTVLYSQIKGIRILESDDESVLLEVGAGEEWHNFVTICLKNKYFGLENMALIPGLVGSAPVQNIGAYGVEQSLYFHSLSGFDINTGKFREINAADCKFDYRNSIFKNELKNQFIVTHVRYKLSKIDKPNVLYKDIRQEIDKFCTVQPDAQYVYDTVCRIRNQKLPDPKLIGNAGSFFKNPIVSADKYLQLKDKFDAIPGYQLTSGEIKLSAAWFIDMAGWKGKRLGNAGVYDKHALVLVNYGNAKGREIYELSEQIRISVIEQFDIALEREVQIVGTI